jgi:hypothetical protein
VRQEGHLGRHAKARTSAAAIMAMSASSSALGSSLTKVSVMNSVCSGSISAFIAAIVRTPGRRADDVAHMVQVLVVAADQAAEHGVGLAAAQHQRADQRVRAPHRRLGTSGVTPSRAIRRR